MSSVAISRAPAKGVDPSIAAYSVAGLPIHSFSSALESYSEACAHSHHPVNSERVFTRTIAYRFPDTGSRTGNQRTSAMA
jgi:hypothetical protein